MLEWFNQQSRRDQIVLVIGSVVLGAYILWSAVVSPLQSRAAQLQASNQEALSQLSWMLESAAEAKARMAAGGSAGASQAVGNLTQLIDSTARAAGLTMKRFQPNGDDQAQVWMDGMPFAAVSNWLYELEVTRGLELGSVSISNASTPGTVNLRVRIKKA